MMRLGSGLGSVPCVVLLEDRTVQVLLFSHLLPQMPLRCRANLLASGVRWQPHGTTHRKEGPAATSLGALGMVCLLRSLLTGCEEQPPGLPGF